VPALYPQDAGLERVEPEVAADEVVVVLRVHAVSPEERHRAREAGVVGGHEPAVPEGAEVLAGEERKAPDVSDRAHRAVVMAGADGLGRVLDDGHAACAGCSQDRIHLCALPEEVDGDDRLRARRHRRSDRRGIDVERHGVDVHEHRPSPEPRHAARRGEERVGGGHHLVSRTDPDGHHGDQ
jgi:hypothetical protein